MQFDNFLNKQVIVTQIKGGSKFNDRQKGNLIGLGLRGIGSSAKVLASQSTIGMIKKVAHAIKVQNA
jgi:ribosomal protein L30/L7E